MALAQPSGGEGGGGFGCSPQGENGKGGGMMSFLPIILIFAILYFVMIRPQQRRQKEHKKLISEVQKGDKVVTSGGIYGVVSNIKEESVIVKAADNVKLEVARSSISRVLEKSSDN